MKDSTPTPEKTLHLTLKKKWFDMILSGEKKEEYRDVSAYWVAILATKYTGAVGGDFQDKHKPNAYRFKDWDRVCFRNGYQKNAPEIIVQFKGIHIGEAKSEWSDNWQGDVFVIRLGNILSTKNLQP